MNKEAYVAAEMEIVCFDTEDVITTSDAIGGFDEGDGNLVPNM